MQMISSLKSSESVSLLCWAHNEEDLIGEFFEKAISLFSESATGDYEIVFVNDCSTDHTLDIAYEYQKRYPQIQIICHERRKNVAQAFLTSIRCATGTYCFWQTIDWSYDLGNLKNKLEELKSWDILVGTRRKAVVATNPVSKVSKAFLNLFGIKHITKRSDTIRKAFISLINYSIIRLLFRFQLSDYQNICFTHTKWLQTLRPEARSPFLTAEFLYKSHWTGKSIKEVEVNFIQRKQGAAKPVRPWNLLRMACDIFRLWFKWIILRQFNFERRGKICRLYSASNAFIGKEKQGVIL